MRRYNRQPTYVLWLLFCLGFVADVQLAMATDQVMAGRSDTQGFQDVWQEILVEAGIPVSFVDAPQGRKRRMFTDGRIMLDCCAAMQWRAQPDEVAVQLWSEPFFVTEERYVFLAGKVRPVQSEADLRVMRIATVRGFNYIGEETFGAIVAGRDTADILQLIEARRADAGIISNVDFSSMTAGRPGVFELGDVRVRAPQRVRVHKDVANLLPLINAAIARLNARGRVVEILLPANIAQAWSAKSGREE